MLSLSALPIFLLSTLSLARAAPAIAVERQQTCPFGHVVSLWVEERTGILPKGALIPTKGGPGVHLDFTFEGDNHQQAFELYTWADGADPAGDATNKFQCYITAPDGVPGDCFEISVRHAWPFISGGRDTLTSACAEVPVHGPAPPL